jgi:predicted MFS family arabinose efflux permease
VGGVVVDARGIGAVTAAATILVAVALTVVVVARRAFPSSYPSVPVSTPAH